MTDNYSFFFKTILSGQTFSFIEGKAQKTKDTSLLLPTSSLYFLCLHLRLSSPFYLTQLSDIFSYEASLNTRALHASGGSLKVGLGAISKSTFSVVVYNFHSLATQNRFFVFSGDLLPVSKSLKSGLNSPLFSISELFYSANWLEREVSELSGIVFLGKKDLRNLMLQYGDSSVPFQKSFPTIGLKEMFYNPVKDVIVQNPVTLQI